MQKLKYAFTMIELVFIIVVLGILSAVAIPKLSGFIDDANYATGTAAVSSIRSAIASERQSNLIKGKPAFPDFLDDANTSIGQELFDGNGTGPSDVRILQYPIYAGTDSGSWKKVTNTTGTAATLEYDYFYKNGVSIRFQYTKSDGRFTCTPADPNDSEDPCVLLTR